MNSKKFGNAIFHFKEQINLIYLFKLRFYPKFQIHSYSSGFKAQSHVVEVKLRCGCEIQENKAISK